MCSMVMADKYISLEILDKGYWPTFTGIMGNLSCI